MSAAIELYGFLILTVLGLALPLLTVLLSLFPEGTRALYTKSENERRQSEENILAETKKQQTEKGLDYSALKKTLKSLARRKQQAETKLEYLRPNKLVAKLSVPFAIAFAGVLIALQRLSPGFTWSALLMSALAFGAGLRALRASLAVLAEVSEMVSDSRRSTHERIVELLSTLVESSGEDRLFLNQEKVHIQFNEEVVKTNALFEFSANKAYEVPVSIVNNDSRMAKKVEAGLILPKTFLVEKTSNLYITTDENTQIVRLKEDIVQARTTVVKGVMRITFLSPGEYEIKSFIKGENLKPKDTPFRIRVIS